MGVIAQAEHRVANLRTRGAEWAESRDPASASGVAIAAWRRYEAVDGPQQSALLALYFLIAIVPALLVIEEYLETTPGALANSLVHHYSLSAQTAELLRSVLVDSRQHELGSALLAVAAALFFGLGFGRVRIGKKLRFSSAAGMQIAATRFHSYDHRWMFSERLSF